MLLPTVSNKVRTSPEEIEEYFSNFLTLKPQGKIDEVSGFSARHMRHQLVDLQYAAWGVHMSNACCQMQGMEAQ